MDIDLLPVGSVGQVVVYLYILVCFTKFFVSLLNFCGYINTLRSSLTRLVSKMIGAVILELDLSQLAFNPV